MLDYPQTPLSGGPGNELNLLIFVIDSMRGSMLNPEFAPNISRYAETEAIRFNNHFSGGNSSRMGMFSLLYSLPPAYWAGFTSLQRSTALLDEMQARDFQLGLYSSGTIYRPVGLDRTAFANVPNLRIMTEPRSDPHWKRDIKAMEEYFQWLDAIEPGRPFFGFLFFEATVAGKAPPDYPVRYEPEDSSENAAEKAS